MKVKEWINVIGKATGRKGKRLFMPVRLAVTGNLAGPDIGAQVISRFSVFPTVVCSVLIYLRNNFFKRILGQDAFPCKGRGSHWTH